MTDNCSAPTMDGYSSSLYISCFFTCAVSIVSVLFLLFLNFSLFVYYKKHAILQIVLTSLFSIFVSVMLHPINYSSVTHFQPAGILSTMGISGVDQFNFLISVIMVIFLALVEESRLWYSLISLDKISDELLSKLVKICQWVNRLTCFLCLVFSSIMATLRKLIILEDGTCPFSFSLSPSISVWITFAICCLVCSSFIISYIQSIYLAKSELVESCHSRPMKNNYRTLLHSLIMRTFIALFFIFVAPPALRFASGSDFVPVLLILALANHGIMSTVISVLVMVRVQYFRMRIGVLVNVDRTSNSVHSIRV